jgi:hypothetical protein
MNIFKSRINTGLKEDERPIVEKQLDWCHEERTGTSVENDPFGNNLETIEKGIEEDQKDTMSCVFHGIGGAFEIERKKDTGMLARTSKIFGYRQRSTFPEEGSIPAEAFKIDSKIGLCLYDTLKTPKTEAEANAIVLTSRMYQEASLSRGKGYFIINNMNDIETLAGVAQKGHAVPICIFADKNEWATDFVKIKNKNLTRTTAGVRHLVYILPESGFMKDGARWVEVQDSAHFGGLANRYVREDFIESRVYFAGYWDTVEEFQGGEKPQYTFTKTLKYGSVGKEVLAVQKLLIHEKLLPADCATGNLFGMTLGAIRLFQNKYAEDILKPIGLNEPTNTWGSMCIAKANSITKMV